MIGKTPKGPSGPTAVKPAKTSTSGADGLARIDPAGGTFHAHHGTAAPTRVGGDIDAITPAPAVQVSALPAHTDLAAQTAAPTLEDFWIALPPGLPEPDVQGVRTIEGRQYVTLANGRFVQVAAVPETGGYRATRSSERVPSGPRLVADADSRYWQEDRPQAPHDLSDTRLEAFRCDLDFTGIEPGSDGLYRFAGKLYAVIRTRAYQVLHDTDASTPDTQVMRIVRAGDAVAHDENNVYFSTRPGRSEPIVFDARRGWVGTSIHGAGGMQRVHRGQAMHQQLVDKTLALETEGLLVQAAGEKRSEATDNWRAQEQGSQGERGALAMLEVRLRQELDLLKAYIGRYVNEQYWISRVKPEGIFRNELHELRVLSVDNCDRLIGASDRRKLIELGDLRGTRAMYEAIAEHLWKKREILQLRQQLVDDILRQSRSSALETALPTTHSMDLQVITSGWVEARSRLLSSDPGDSQSALAQWARSYIETASAFHDIDSVPQQARLAIITGLLDQTAAIKASYENLAFAPDSAEAGVRRQIIEVMQSFEETLEKRASRYHREQLTTLAMPAQDEVIDFDFVPNQENAGPAPARRRLFRARHHDVYKISVGLPRRTASGEEVIDVTDPGSVEQVWQTYERRDGEWRRQAPPPDMALPTLMALANERMGQCEAHLRSARQDEKARRNASNIVEFLGAKAEQLDDVALQLERQPNAADDEIAVLISQLRQNSQRLRQEGEDIRVRLYKDKSFLSASRVAYLLGQNQIVAMKTHTRLERGKGSNKHYLDIYSLNDRRTGEPLWHAHFHYAKADSAAGDFTVQGGHLKTLEQSGSGLASQRRDQQAGRVHVPIWREAIDSRTAQKIFDVAQ